MGADHACCTDMLKPAPAFLEYIVTESNPLPHWLTTLAFSATRLGSARIMAVACADLGPVTAQLVLMAVGQLVQRPACFLSDPI